MFSNKVIGSDEFLEMPDSTQNLYFHLSMNADDDGFVDKVKSIMRMTGKKEDDLRILIAKKFIIPFESGVIVIRHWRVNNYLRSDRYRETQHLEEKSLLSTRENGEYSIGIPVVDQLDTQYRLDKSRLDKNNILCENENDFSPNVECTMDSLIPAENEIFDFWNSTEVWKHRELDSETVKAIKKALKKFNKEEIKQFISRYAIVMKDESYFFNTKWKLKEFLTRKGGILDFTDEGSKWVNYVNNTGYVEQDVVVEEVSFEDKESF